MFDSQWYANGDIMIITWQSATTAHKTGWNTGSGSHIPTIVLSATLHGEFTDGGTTKPLLNAFDLG